MAGIERLWETMPLGIGKTEGRTAAVGEAFTDIFSAAVSAVRETGSEASQAEYLLATGQLDNPAALTTALTKAQLSVDLLVQLRNKTMDAYSELMRISL